MRRNSESPSWTRRCILTTSTCGSNALLWLPCECSLVYKVFLYDPQMMSKVTAVLVLTKVVGGRWHRMKGRPVPSPVYDGLRLDGNGNDADCTRHHPSPFGRLRLHNRRTTRENKNNREVGSFVSSGACRSVRSVERHHGPNRNGC